jgi:DMSO/TMAO reductase YedYZ molybdopterin-dependent catalytic subunit
MDQPAPTSLVPRRSASAGALAATIMVATQLAWRLLGSNDASAPSLPEIVVSAIARLTPLSVFGAATETYGSLAKKTLFVSVLVGIILAGALAGRVAGRMARDGGFAVRLRASGIIATVAGAAVGLVVLPIAHLGVFAAGSSRTGAILLQLAVTLAIFAVAWAILAGPAFARQQGVSASGQPLSRRSAIAGFAWTGSALAAATATAIGAWRIVTPRDDTPATREAPDAATRDIVATERAQAAPAADASPAATPQPAPANGPFAAFDALEAEGRLTPVLTEVGDFYHVSKNLFDPTVSDRGWALTITGLVEQELRLNLQQLTQRATTAKITTLMCISNTLNGEYVGTARWTGVPLADLLAEAGVKPEGIEIKLHAADDYEESFPIAFGFDPDTLVVVGMNDAPLTDSHGFPARIIVPGIYGMKNVKWVDRIEVISTDFLGYWQTRGWSDPAIPQIWGRIDTPASGKIDAGPQVAAGVAAAGDRDISRVEVSLDDGTTWADAQLEPAINAPFTWVRWMFPFEAVSGEKYRLRMRATDGKGDVMLQEIADPLPDGATGWPLRVFEVR